MFCGLASACIVPVSDADFLSDLMANPPQASYADRQGATAAVRPVDPPELRQSSVAQRDAVPQRRAVMISPESANTRSGRAADQTLGASQAKPRRAIPMRSVVRQKIASNLRTASAPSVAKRAGIAHRQAGALREATAYQRNQAPRVSRVYQPLTAPDTQAARTGPYPSYSQQPAYAAAPNYYRGYSYQGWGANDRAACGPGRV
jgi:hypothetical protein